MGSLRRGLILAFLPGAAWAEVCDKVRPGWNGAAYGPVDEALALAATPLSLVLIVATALAWRFRNQWAGLAVVLGWTLMASFVAMTDPTGLGAEARAEGCMAAPTLFIAAVAAICIATILYTAPLARHMHTGDR